MALVKTFNQYEMQELFRNADRDYFSLDGYQAILDLFDQDEQDTEMDVVGICCDFTEDEPIHILGEYDCLSDYIGGADADDDAILDALNYYTFAVALPNGNILYQNF